MPDQQIIVFLYSLALYGALIAGAPFWLFRMATTSKYREGLAERLGKVPRRLRLPPHLLDAEAAGAVIWVHAVSVGEVLAASRLIFELQSAGAENRAGEPERLGHEVFVSTTTRTGQTLARARFGEERVFYFPLDLRWVVRRYMRALKPSLLVLVETEFWPNMLAECALRSIPVVVVNARISDRSYPRYMRLRSLWRRILSSLTLVLAQSEEDVQRLKSIGIPEERACWAGNLKYDVGAPEETAFTVALGSHLRSETRLLVAGSTLEGEERMLVEAWPQLQASMPDVAMVLAPRHPERFDAVAQLLDRSAAKWKRRSDWMKAPQVLEPGTIFLLDSIGELASVYSLAAVAFVGGSLVPSGGHNPLEPAQFAVPVVMGPHYVNFRAIVDELRHHSAILIAEKEEFIKTLKDLLLDRREAAALGKRGKEVFQRHAGATGRALSAINALLEQRARDKRPA